MAQDERYFREIISGDLVHEKSKDQAAAAILSYSKVYEFDLTGNHRFERIIFERRDGVDWVTVYNYQKELILEYQLDTQAADSRVYKLKLNNISSTKRLLTLYFYSGATDYLTFKANTRLYFITFNVNDLSQMCAQKGPVFWEEFNNKKGHYHQRFYNMQLKDIDSSNTKELIVSFRTIRRVYRLNNEMEWIEM
jgi:hypothetical protein